MGPTRTVVAGLAGLCAIAAVQAADIAPVDTLIVTATRTEIPLHDATVPVTVISREDIELSLANDLAELLRFQAGIDIGRNGGPGQATSLFLRGTESNHTLVLIDGVRINPGTLGGAAIQHIAPELIDRIEIVKGARSALFGTDAIGGVINVITRRADDSYLESSVGGGSFDTRSGFLSGGRHGPDGEFGVTVNWQQTDGYAPHTASVVERGYDNLSANFYASRGIGPAQLSFRHWQTQGTVEYLDFSLQPADQDFENRTTAVQVDNELGPNGTSKLIVSAMQDEITQNQSADFVTSDRVSVDWQYSLALPTHTLTGGLYAVDETATSVSFGSGFDEDTRVRAVFVQDQWAGGPHRTFLALRLTDHQSFGHHATWNAEYALEIGKKWSMTAGLGHAFRAPDATDRFGFGGRPDLEPEVAGEAQLGLRYAPGSSHSVDLEFYRNDIDDLIDFDLQSFQLQNIDAAHIRGAQLGYEYRGDNFVFRAETVSQRADNARTGERLLRRAERTATLSYTQDIGAHRVGLSVFASGEREDFGGVVLPGYVLANLTAQFALGPRWALHARVENLLDTNYQTAADFRMPERGTFFELKYHWR